MINFKELPKVDLHHHFDGAFRPESLFAEAGRRNLPQASLDKETFIRRVQVSPDCNSLTEFLATFDLFYDIAQNIDFLEKAAYELALDLKEDNVVYCETRFAPHLFINNEVSVEQVVGSVLKGFKKARNEIKNCPEIFLILCLMRGAPAFQARQLPGLFRQYNDDGVVGLDLAGDESKFKGLEYKSIYSEASSDNIPVTIHAGEAAGADSVWSALKDFKASRIGHGIKSLEDDKLVAYLKEKKVPLEVCVTSNVQTGTVPSVEEHPLPRLLQEGLCVTLNTDDPAISAIDLSHEWNLVSKTFSIGQADVKSILENSLGAAFGPDKSVQRARTSVDQFFTNL